MAEAEFNPQEGEIVVLEMVVVSEASGSGMIRVRSAEGPLSSVYLTDVVGVKPKPLSRLDRVRPDSDAFISSPHTGRIVHIEGEEAWVKWGDGCSYAPVWTLNSLQRA